MSAQALPRPCPAAAAHSLFWLAAANGLGLLLAALLLWPQLNQTVAPLTYGRWVPLHLNFQLYGWCSLPLVGLLCRLFWDDLEAPAARLAPLWWSLALAAGGVSWLAGHSSGKIFLEWRGVARVAFPLAMTALWLTLALGLARRAPSLSRTAFWGRAALLALLAVAPIAIFAAADPGVYPPVNPQSGGATGGSLLGSTLGIVGVFLLAPPLLQGAPRPGWRMLRPYLAGLTAHFAFFALLDHGNRGNREPLQILALASLFLWAPALIRYWRSFDWPAATRVWLGGLAFWGIALLVDGWVLFLPGVLDRLKFTNALTGHAHMAMAGMLTSFLMLLLLRLAPRLTALGSRPAAWLWQTALVGHAAVLTALGFAEADGALFLGAPLPRALFAARFALGAVMFLVSVYWFWRCAVHPRDGWTP